MIFMTYAHLTCYALVGGLATVLPLTGCSPKSNNHAVLQSIKVTAAGFESGGEFCSDFKMTAEDVLDFFKRAKIIDSANLHSDYAYLPCYIQGYAKLNDAEVTWEIRAGGTGKLLMPDGQVSLYGCLTCDDLFGGRK